MSTDTKQKGSSDSGIAKPPSVAAEALSLARLNPKRLGLGFGATGVIFYLGCMLLMAAVTRETAVVIFNSLLHGLNVEPILRTSVPVGEVVMGLIGTFVLGWLAGLIIAGIYNAGLQHRKSDCRM